MVKTTVKELEIFLAGLINAPVIAMSDDGDDDMDLGNDNDMDLDDEVEGDDDMWDDGDDDTDEDDGFE